MKALIFDSGPLINLSMNGLLFVIEKLKALSNLSFIITPDVEREVIERPLTIPKFELGALRIQSLLERGVLERPDKTKILLQNLVQETRRMMVAANNLMQIDGNPISIVSEAEMSCLALGKMLESKGYETLIAIDERTARMICEKPDNLAALMSERLHKKVKIAGDVSVFSKLKIIRTSELLYVAYKKGLIELKNAKALEALILAAKFKGTSISWDEISELKRL